MTERELPNFRPPETVGWVVFGVDDEPGSPEDIAEAFREEVEGDEMAVIGIIAALHSIHNNPYLNVFKIEGTETYTIEVIIPPENTGMIEVYKRYNE